MTQEESNIDTVRRFFAAVAKGAQGDDLGRFYAPDVVQEEFPNRFAPNGVRRDLAAIQAAAARGQGVMAQQELELLHVVASGDTVAVEARWSGTLGAAVGTIPGGTVMRARFAQFLVLRDGRIVAHRTYDCFDPW